MKQLSVFIFVFFHIISFAQNDFFDGVKAYEKEDYNTAANNFRSQTIKHSSDVAAFYNLGLSLLEMDSIGKAIWAFEKVLKYSPNDSEAQLQLETCYATLDTPLLWSPTISPTKSFLFALSSNFWAWSSIVLSILFAAMIILYARSKNQYIRRITVLASVFFVASLIFALIIGHQSKNYFSSNKIGIVTKSAIPTYTKTKEKTTDSLLEGDRLIIKDSLDGELYIVTNLSGESHIVHKTDFERI